LESYKKSKKKKREVANVKAKPKTNGMPDLKHNHYSTTLWATRRLHDKLTFSFKLCHATRPNVGLAEE